MSTGETGPRPRRRALWVVGVVALVGLLMSVVGTAVLGSEGLRYLLSVTGSDVVDVSTGLGTSTVEPGRTYGLLVPQGSNLSCRVWEPDGTPVRLSGGGATFTLETPQGRWTGHQSLTGPEAGTVVLACEPAGPGASVRLVATPDWSLGPALALVLLVVVGSALFGIAAIALVVILVRRRGARDLRGLSASAAPPR